MDLRSKRAAVLRTLLERGQRGLSCFEAVSVCHDFVLRSTISSLCGEYGLSIPRRRETVAGFGGSLTDCMRYTLSTEDVARARELLASPASASAERAASEAELPA